MIKVLFTLEVSMLGEVSSCFTDSLSNLPNIGEKVIFSSEDNQYFPIATVFDKTINYRPDMTVASVNVKIRYPFEEWLDKWKGWLVDNFGLDVENWNMSEIIPLSNEYLFSVFEDLDKIDLMHSAFLHSDIDFMKRNKDLFFFFDEDISLLDHFINYYKLIKYKT